MHNSFLHSIRRQIIATLASPDAYGVSFLNSNTPLNAPDQHPICLTLDAEIFRYQGQYESRNTVILMIAHDLGLEPSLPVFNGLDKRKVDKHHTDLETENFFYAATPKSFEKVFYDSAQFEGSTVTSAKSFIVQNNSHGGLDIYLNATQKNILLTLSSVLKAALDDESPAEEKSARSSDVLSALESGKRVPSYDERPWLYNKVRYDQSDAFLIIARHLLHNRLGVRRHQFTTISADDHTYIISIQQDALANAWSNLSHAKPYESLMRRGILPTDGDQMRLLNTLFADVAAYGADLEDYMVGNPEIADTMMRLLINCEAYEVLASLQAMQPKQP